ncbi:MAG: response regulator [Bacteroidales bacterium]|jgi:two-component system sensor histidine kinase/response regulator|nr:response regulator [Bacteroidales bacterium]
MTEKKILVVDDSNTNIVLLESLLERNGYTVFTAGSGRQGLDSMRNMLPDLIVLDLKMPDLGGFEFLEVLRENDDWMDIPVVILSAVSDSDSIKKAMELGATDYLTKPLDPDKVIKLADSILT